MLKYIHYIRWEIKLLSDIATGRIARAILIGKEDYMGDYQKVTHTFEPIYNEHSKILILGSLPSVKSREEGFYYGHPRNRFWKMLSELLECREPATIEEKKKMLLAHGIALWDVIASCEIKGSSDSSIKNVIPADIQGLLRKTSIKKIYANGKTAGSFYKKYIEPTSKISCTVLPSTSPANAAYRLEDLLHVWNMITMPLVEPL